VQFGAAHDMTGGGAHDGHELAGFHGPGRRGGDLRVHVPHGDGDALRQTRPGRGFGREVTRGVAEPADSVLEFGADEVLELGVQRRQEVLGRVAAVLIDAFVAGSSAASALTRSACGCAAW
jgi:hypothetical protein